MTRIGSGIAATAAARTAAVRAWAPSQTKQHDRDRHRRGEAVPVADRVAEPAGGRGQERPQLLAAAERRLEAAQQRQPGDDHEPEREAPEPGPSARSRGCDHHQHEHPQVAERPDDLHEGAAVVARPTDRDRHPGGQRGEAGAGAQRRGGNARARPSSERQRDHHRPPDRHRGPGDELVRVAAVRDREGDVEDGDGDGDHRLQRGRPARARLDRCPILRAACRGITILCTAWDEAGFRSRASPVSPELG